MRAANNASNDENSGSQSENRSAWPNMSFASMLQQNAGFNTTNTCYHKQARNNHAKSARIQNYIDKHSDLPDLFDDIECNYRVLICMRGAPGSGKSYLARAIVDRTLRANHVDHIYSTDDFFIDARTQKYQFDRSRLSEAHEWNQRRVAQRAASGWSPIIIDNTNMKLWEMAPYVREAVNNGYLIRIIEPNTPWRIAVGKLAQRNSHGVSQEHIARMLEGFEPGNVRDVLRSMKIYNYDNPEPKLRNLPEIVEAPDRLVRPPSKEQRQERYFNQDNRNRFNSANEGYSYYSKKMQTVQEDSSVKLPTLDQEWQPFEQESESFWGTDSNQNESNRFCPKPQRNQSDESNVDYMYRILRDRPSNATQLSETVTAAEPKLKRHKKFCRNENESFQNIRQLFPDVAVAPLWDLFEKCNGDGDWTVDIILNERESMGIETLNTQEEIDRDNFSCDCDRIGGAAVSQNNVPLNIAANTEYSRTRIVPAQSVRRKQMVNNEHEVRKQINGLFVIPDAHYSQHTRKIRDNRYAATTATVTSASTSAMAEDFGEASGGGGGGDNDDDEDDNDIIPIDLGIELVCQLDQRFGSSSFQHDQLKDFKTTVFMSKALGQQLYALWVESMYNQLEEQRQQSIKDDEEFAIAIQRQEQTNGKQQASIATQPKITDIADMEYVWKAYNTDSNEWKHTTREDLATKLTKAKLFEIFPHVDREQLLHVFSACRNNFRQTVDFLKEELKNDIDDKVLTNGQQLLDHVRSEAQTVSLI